MLTLGQAARHCGVSKGTISKAIASGKLSATRREDGSWAIDGAELARYLDVNGHRFRSETGSGEQPATIAELRARAELAEQRLSDLKAMLDDMRRQRDDAERQRDKWETVATRLSLSAPKLLRWRTTSTSHCSSRTWTPGTSGVKRIQTNQTVCGANTRTCSGARARDYQRYTRSVTTSERVALCLRLAENCRGMQTSVLQSVLQDHAFSKDCASAKGSLSRWSKRRTSHAR
jgi:helix-turn-helix protein